MSDETYNGWKNYPTWAVNLWLSNDQGESDMWLRTAQDALRHSETPRAYLADALKDEHAEAAERMVDLPASVFTDLLGYALDQVDWYEIADAWIENVQESVV